MLQGSTVLTGLSPRTLSGTIRHYALTPALRARTAWEGSVTRKFDRGITCTPRCVLRAFSARRQGTCEHRGLCRPAPFDTLYNKHPPCTTSMGTKADSLHRAGPFRSNVLSLERNALLSSVASLDYGSLGRKYRSRFMREGRSNKLQFRYPLCSTGPTGSGLCPKGFYCPVGTAVPIPSPKGFFSDLEGMVSASVCLPGFYSPTIEVRLAIRVAFCCCDGLR